MQVVVRRKVRRVNAMVFSCAWDQLEYHVLDRSAPRVKLEQLLEMPQNNTAATSAAIHNRDSTRPDAGRVYLVDPHKAAGLWCAAPAISEQGMQGWNQFVQTP